MRGFLVYCSFALFNLVALSAHAQNCTISVGPAPSSSSVGSIIRNPGFGASIQSVFLPISIACPTPQSVEFSTQNAKLINSEDFSQSVSYGVKSSVTNNGSLQTPPNGSTFISLGTMTSASVTGNIILQAVAVQNLQPGTYSDRISIRVGGASGQIASLDLNAFIPIDCSVLIGAPPNPSELGAYFKNPAGRSIPVPVSFSCNTYQASVSVSALNGYFKPSDPTNQVQIEYQLRLSAGALVANSATVNSNSIGNGNWTTLGYLSSTTVSTNVLFSVNASPILPPDTYTETVYLRVNAP